MADFGSSGALVGIGVYQKLFGANTRSTTNGALSANAAVTLRAWLMLSVQVAVVPVQAPLQPTNPAPLAATAVSVTWVPLS